MRESELKGEWCVVERVSKRRVACVTGSTPGGVDGKVMAHDAIDFLPHRLNSDFPHIRLFKVLTRKYQ